MLNKPPVPDMKLSVDDLIKLKQLSIKRLEKEVDEYNKLLELSNVVQYQEVADILHDNFCCLHLSPETCGYYHDDWSDPNPGIDKTRWLKKATRLIDVEHISANTIRNIFSDYKNIQILSETK